MRKLVVLFLFLASCSQESGGGGDTTFLLPWQAEDGTYNLQEVKISTLASPLELRGEAAEVYYRTGFNNDGYQGSVARPRVVRSGKTYVPTDAESSLAIAVYAQFDKLFRFEAVLGTRSQLTWPRKVGIELNMVGADGGTHNNAHYFTNLDVIGVVPYNKEGVPIALNHGIVAHEHFHAHFQSQVMNALNSIPMMVPNVYGNNQDSLVLEDDMDQRTYRGLNNLILRGWNEGLADLFGAIYTGKADYGSSSLPGFGEFRSLDGNLSPMMSSGQLLTIARTVKMSKGHKMDIAYTQGTVLARMLYRMAVVGTENPNQLLSRVMLRLKNLPKILAPELNSKVFEFEDIVPVILEGYPFNARSCRALEASVSAATVKRSFAKCSAL